MSAPGSSLRAVDRPLLAIGLMLGFCVLAPLGDALAKILGTRMGLGQMIAARFLVQAVLLAPIVLVMGTGFGLSARLLRLMVLRTVLHVAGVGLMFLSLRYLPLADAIAILFVMPFMILILGHYTLGEVVGRRRLSACAVGFAGTLMVIQPSFVEVGWAALLPIATALAFSLFMLVTRHVAREMDPIRLQAVTAVMASFALVPILIAGHMFGLPELLLTGPVGFEWTLLLLIGVVGTAAHLLLTWSLRYAPAATLAPMQYFEIPVATILGWLIFDALPNGLAAVGILVTVLAGLYVIYRERVTARASEVL